MTTTVIGTFDSAKAVQQVMAELRKVGFENRSVEVLEGERDEIMDVILGRGFAKEDAQAYAEGAASGRKLVAASGSDEEVGRAVDVMERFEAPAQEGTSERSSAGRNAASILEVEEELSISKRQVARGGVRLTTSVSERPVEKTVRLREAKVEAKRRAVDRALDESEAREAFSDRTIEMAATGEEVEVRKEARVTGEVTLAKQVKERQQTVKDTVRRTEVEEIDAKASKSR